jgi:hypothetical protein
VPHETADFAFEAEGLFLGGFGEFLLQRILLSAVAFLFAFVVPFALRHSSAFPSLVQRHGVSLMNFTLWTVRGDFFGNVQLFHYQLANRKHAHSYTFFAPKGNIAAFKGAGGGFL